MKNPWVVVRVLVMATLMVSLHHLITRGVGAQPISREDYEQHVNRSERESGKLEELVRRIDTIEKMDIGQRITKLETSSDLKDKIMVAVVVAVLVQYLQALFQRRVRNGRSSERAE